MAVNKILNTRGVKHVKRTRYRYIHRDLGNISERLIINDDEDYRVVRHGEERANHACNDYSADSAVCQKDVETVCDKCQIIMHT